MVRLHLLFAGATCIALSTGCPSSTRIPDADVGIDAGAGRSDAASDAGHVDAVDADADADADAGDPAPNADVIARAGAVIGSCLGDDGANRVIESLWHPELGGFWSLLADGIDCLASADTGCAALEACLGLRFEIASCATTSTCDGDVWIACGEGRLTWDCARIGRTCDPLGGCVTGPVEMCDRASFVPDCTEEGAPRYCRWSGGAVEGPNCEDLGLVCSAGECRGTGPACAGDGSPDGAVALRGLRCEGTQMTACVEGAEHGVDCATLEPGFTCQEVVVAGVPRVFCGIAAECAPGDVQYATCTDTTSMVVCNAGRVDVVDCTDLGFTGCEMFGGQARCVPFF